MDKYLVIILGPTGIGKTSLAVKVAKHFKTEIISSDSRQIYQETKIGTAVPSAEELKEVVHHQIATKSVKDYYNASMFEQEVLEISEQLFKKYNPLVMVGGSGLYIDAVCKGIDELPDVDQELRNELIIELNEQGIESLRAKLKKIDPVYYEKVDLKNPKRILKALEISIMTGKPYSSQLTSPKKERQFKTIKIGLNMDREFLYERINKRVDIMVSDGLEEEARNLYPLREYNALNTVGYKEFFDFFDNKHSREKAIELIKRNTRRYARRQLTWFRRDNEIKWFEPNESEAVINEIENILLF